MNDNMSKLTFTEILSSLKLNQCLIDDIIREGRINESVNHLSKNKKLQYLNKQKEIIKAKAEELLNETFNQQDNK